MQNYIRTGALTFLRFGLDNSKSQAICNLRIVETGPGATGTPGKSECSLVFEYPLTQNHYIRKIILK